MNGVQHLDYLAPHYAAMTTALLKRDWTAYVEARRGLYAALGKPCPTSTFEDAH